MRADLQFLIKTGIVDVFNTPGKFSSKETRGAARETGKSDSFTEIYRSASITMTASSECTSSQGDQHTDSRLHPIHDAHLFPFRLSHDVGAPFPDCLL